MKPTKKYVIKKIMSQIFATLYEIGSLIKNKFFIYINKKAPFSDKP